MLFNSFAFATFLAVVLVLYILTMRRLRLQNALLLVASYFFYGCWDWRFLSLIGLSTLIDFVCGRALDRRSEGPPNAEIGARGGPYAYDPQKRKMILWVSVAANLGILGLFKYFDFFAGSAAALLTAIGLPLEPRLLNVVLPVGISFYTFQSLSYTIDVYRGKIHSHNSLLEFAVFVSFFPQLVAGPIVRAREFLPQVSRPRRLDLNQVYEGGYLMFWGLFKKVVIADNLALLVDGVFEPASAPLGGAVLVALYAFTLQVYCDFSGYSDMARGCAKVLGFELRLNFNLPYFASSPSEFWRRWHISLSTWLRDYLYIPLGGDRKGSRRTMVNVLLTMILSGLWHGAAWTFVLWGVYHGVLLIVYRAVTPRVERAVGILPATYRRAAHWFAVVLFFHWICLGLLIFRADSMAQIGQFLSAMAAPWCWWILMGVNTVAGTGFWTLFAFVAPLLIVQAAQYYRNDLNVLLSMPVLVRGLAYAVMFYGLLIYEGGSNRPFVYFQF